MKSSAFNVYGVYSNDLKLSRKFWVLTDSALTLRVVL